MCRLHQRTSDPKPLPRIKKSEFKGDAEFYASIWKERPRLCEETGTVLPYYKPDDPKYTFKIRMHMQHVLPKSKYPQFRHDKRNIILLSFAAHQRADNGDPRQLRKMNIWTKCKAIMMELLGEIPNEHKF